MATNESCFTTSVRLNLALANQGKSSRIEQESFVHWRTTFPNLSGGFVTSLQKLHRNISHLLIDGNNACYEGGDLFIGLRAISALLRSLGAPYKITVVFDASIRSLLKTDPQGIERALGPTVSTHVVPSGTAADEYLLKLADKDDGAFILSNDRYAEYHDYDVVRSGRLLKFMIADGKLMVNDLDINVGI